MDKMYFVALVLPKDLDEKILVYKKWMREAYGCKVGLKSPAHITLVPPFWMKEEKESALKQDLNNVAIKSTSFPLATNNFSSFSHRTLFIAVKENAALDALKKTVDEVLYPMEYGLKKESRPFHPHITIATRDLHKKDFFEVWPRFEGKTFEEEFEAAGLSLLKHNGRTWDVVYTAGFTA